MEAFSISSSTTTPAKGEQAMPGIGPYQVASSIWLTPIVHADAAEQNRVFNIDDRISKGLFSEKITFPFSMEASQRFVTRHEEKRIKDGNCSSWAIRTQVDGPMIGLLAISPFDHGNMGPCFRGKEPVAAAETLENGENDMLRCCELGYWLSPEYVGKGIMTQVVRYALAKMARQVFGYDRVHAEAWKENLESQRVMERAGMRPAVGVPVFVPKFNTVKDIAHYIYDAEDREDASGGLKH
ncbi:hypothetical protein FBU30_009987 [Linnemannia zychae]|nr:hypothetical protein FBU30_009987 [Linnemannia zychae]